MNQPHTDSLDTAHADGEPDIEVPDRGVFYANSLFDRHGIPMQDRSRLAEKVLKLAYSAAHRRMRGEKSLTFREMAILASHFGETLDQVFAAALDAASVDATMVIAGERLACQMWVGEPISAPVTGSLVATKEDSDGPCSRFQGSSLKAPSSKFNV